MSHSWFTFTPAYTNQRGSQQRRLGAHAFRPFAARSLCGYVARDRAGCVAVGDQRRCVWCERVVAGKSKDLGGSP